MLFPGSQAVFTGAAVTVATTWSLSIEHANGMDPAWVAGPLLALAGVLDPAGIPEQVLSAPAALDYLTHHRTASADGGAAAPRGAVTSDDVEAALGNLRRFSLIGSVRPMVQVHGLVQRAVRESLIEDELDSAAVAAADALLQRWPDVERDTDLVAVLHANTAAVGQHHTTGLMSTGVHGLVFRAARSLSEAGLLHAAIGNLDAVREQAHHALGLDHPDTLTTRHNLAYWRAAADSVTPAAEQDLP